MLTHGGNLFLLFRRIVASIGGFGFAFFMTACGKDTIVNIEPDSPNQPPMIVTHGPGLPAGVMEITSTYDAPALWVLVGDPDGLDDISAVFLQIDSVLVRRVLLRPDSLAGFAGCAWISYAPNDTIDVSSVVPIRYSEISSQPMARQQGGLYSTGDSPFPPITFSSIIKSIPSSGPQPKGCGFNGDSFKWFGLYPPSVPQGIDVFLTYADVEYRDIAVTVYDKVGAKAAVTFPNLKIKYTTWEEKRVSP
jgi:hypothetical protein